MGDAQQDQLTQLVSALSAADMDRVAAQRQRPGSAA